MTHLEMPSFFKMLTLMAFRFFIDEKVCTLGLVRVGYPSACSFCQSFVRLC